MPRPSRRLLRLSGARATSAKEPDRRPGAIRLADPRALPVARAGPRRHRAAARPGLPRGGGGLRRHLAHRAQLHRRGVYCDPIPFAAALASRTRRIRIGFAVIQLALRHPVRLAVELALLDNLSQGRLDVGVGRGSLYNEYEYVGYGLRSDDARERAAEALDGAHRGVDGQAPFSYAGKHFQVQFPALRPRPVSVRIRRSGAARCGRLVRGMRAARRADHDLAAAARADPERASASTPMPSRRAGIRRRAGHSACAIWRSGVTSTWGEPGAGRGRAGRCRPSHAPAHAARAPGMEPGRFPRGPERGQPVQRSGRRRRRGGALGRSRPARSTGRRPGWRSSSPPSGTRESIIVLCQMSFGYLPHERIMASMRRFGEAVMPRFR